MIIIVYLPAIIQAKKLLEKSNGVYCYNCGHHFYPKKGKYYRVVECPVCDVEISTYNDYDGSINMGM